MEIIVPAAGLSTRFPAMKPKYLLYDYNHKLMLHNAIQPYLGKYSITIGILALHNEEYDASEFIYHEFGDQVNIVILDEPTNGPADTVYQILRKINIPDFSEIFIKDCDSFFDHEVTAGNYICVSDIADHKVLTNLKAKSFITTNEQGIVNNIIEKKVVSNLFCVGGYKFNKAIDYINTFESINSEHEIFVSDIISKMLQNNVIFSEKKVDNYVDVGTSDQWFKYNDKPVIFCDIDGTIIKAQSRVGVNSYDQPPVILMNNVNKLLEYQENGSQLIFTTSRETKYSDITMEMLESLGFKKFGLLTNLPNSRRILINDFNNANPFPRAEAINIERNSDILNKYL